MALNEIINLIPSTRQVSPRRVTHNGPRPFAFGLHAEEISANGGGTSPALSTELGFSAATLVMGLTTTDKRLSWRSPDQVRRRAFVLGRNRSFDNLVGAQ